MKQSYFLLFFLALTLNASGQNFFSTGRRTSGYVDISEFGYAPSIDGRAGAITISTINGYKPSDHFSAGLGVSYTRFSNGPADIVNFLPIFADLRTYIGGRTALMLVGDIGYGLSQAIYNGDRYERSEHSDDVSIKLGFLF